MQAIFAQQPMTLLLVGANVAVYLLMVLRGLSAVSPSQQGLLRWGADWGPLSLGSQPWRMLTSNYVHIGIFHIFFNMWCLWNLGFLAERIFGRWTYLLIYTASGIAGSLASLWWHPMVVGAGASGAIFGVAGAAIAALYLGKLPIPKEAIQRTMKSLLTFAGYNLLLGSAVRGIDNSAHVGGLLGGLICGAALSKHLLAPPDERRRWRLIVLVAVIIGLLAGGNFVKRRFDPTEYAERSVPKLTTADYANAVAEMQAAVREKPDSAESRYVLGRAYLGARQPVAAIASLQEALRLQPDYPDAEVALGFAYAVKGMKEEAQDAFKKSTYMHGGEK
jgi:rhomboid protease GluP